jgi:hypothetical protein
MVKKFSAFMDPESSLLHSQKPTTRPFPTKLKSVKPHTLYLHDQAQYCLCIYSQSSGLVSCNFPDHNFV